MPSVPTQITYIVVGYAVLVALLALMVVLRKQERPGWLDQLAWMLEVLLVVRGLAGLGAFQGNGPPSTSTYIGYLIASVCVLPIAMKTRENRFGVGFLVAAVRMDQFDAAYRDLLVSAPGRIGLVRNDGALLVSVPSDMLDQQTAPATRAFLSAIGAHRDASTVMIDLPSPTGEGATMAAAEAESIGPLAGAVVIDLSTTLPGAQATQFLADCGADVIMVEPPDGSPLRQLPGWPALLRGKRSVALDLHDDADLDRLRRLLDHADVLVSTLRPAAAERLGMTAAVLAERYPRLVVATITGWCDSYDLRIASRLLSIDFESWPVTYGGALSV